ncbi:3'-5' exonuclease [Bacteroides sp. 519]|uniref:3'-5' exonuclease n=1 Tax=Bacteroides sp. 519 TaxID=2302937 RepID=UPI0013D71FA5|nr:3'-5' exonuclease [Bacteroides sp. 519]NDV58625.1 3'-5' exonuclease domain-containing protein 2 [Bacteroides sp. 519]
MVIKRKINKEEVKELPKASFPGRIIVIQTEEEANKAVDYLLTKSVVGIDSETRPSFSKGQSHKVALLQVSSEDSCFLFRLNHIGLPSSLIKFMESELVVKVGLSLKDDFLMLRKRAPFKPQNCIELQQYVKDVGIEEMSLRKIYAILFGQKISKSQQLSNWETDILSDSQKQYAATDAWACLHIYNRLEHLKDTGNYELEPEDIYD